MPLGPRAPPFRQAEGKEGQAVPHLILDGRRPPSHPVADKICFQHVVHVRDVSRAALHIYPNMWPEQPGFRPTMERFYLAARLLGDALFEVFAEVLGMPTDYFATRATRRAPSTMRLLHYPGTERPSMKSNVGIAAHTDFECFTLILQTAPGLELTDAHGHWREAPSTPGQFIVILGDMMERLSNGAFKATGHRVGITPWERYAVILFNALDGDCEVTPLPAFVTDGNPAAYPSVTQAEHIAAEIQRAQGLLESDGNGD